MLNIKIWKKNACDLLKNHQKRIEYASVFRIELDV